MVEADGRLPLPWFDAALDGLARAPRGHALLLHGPPGVGQFELAIVLAQAWLCEDRPTASLRPCGRCAGCRLLLAHSHPDLLVLLPEAMRDALGWNTDDGADDAPEAKKKPSREIKVDAVRGAVTFTQRTASRGGAKVVVVHPAEAMNGIAANTLLKTLEEPPPAVRFVVCTSAPDQLLPTIRSRCQPWRLDVPASDVALEWLREQGVADAAPLLAATGGQPLTVREWHADGLDAARWRAVAEAVRRGDASALVGWPVPRVIEAMIKLAHDSARMGQGAAPRFFEASLLSPARDASNLAAWGRHLMRLQRQADHPWHAALLIETLVTQGQRALA